MYRVKVVMHRVKGGDVPSRVDNYFQFLQRWY